MLQYRPITPSLLRLSPEAVRFGCFYKNGAPRIGAIREFLALAFAQGIEGFLDERNRLFVDICHPFWGAWAEDGNLVGISPTLTSQDVTPHKHARPRTAAAEKQAKYRRRRRRLAAK